jgi:LPXTG-motif cell wall-anchored protein
MTVPADMIDVPPPLQAAVGLAIVAGLYFAFFRRRR